MKKEPWHIAAARFCVDNAESGVTSTELKNHIKELGYKVSGHHLEFFFQEELQQPTGRQFSRVPENGRYTPPLEMVSTITDFDELREARKNSKQAFWLGFIAIVISLITLLFTALNNC
jgi:hypothetical protein